VRIDRQEEGQVRAEKVAHLSQRYGRLKQEIEKLKAMEKVLADAPDGQISLTDPDARAMSTSARNSGLVGYNAQCVVDTETHIIVTHEVTNKGFDRDQFSPMAMAAKDALGHDTLHAFADKGVFQRRRDCRLRQGGDHGDHAVPGDLGQSQERHVCEGRLQIRRRPRHLYLPDRR
jgi:hypothetical protein